MRGLTALEQEIIRSMCRFDLNMRQTGIEMQYHHNTIRYHVEQIYIKTGLDCRRFYDALKLLQMITPDDRDTCSVCFRWGDCKGQDKKNCPFWGHHGHILDS